MRVVIAAGLLALLLVPSTSRAQVDHLEVLQAPQLADCADGRPYFRVMVNAVDVNRRPVGVGLSPSDAKKSFRVSEGAREHTVQYVTLFESGQAKSPGNYFMLLIDTSGSMKSRLPAGGTRFTEAKAAIARSLTNFTDGVDHIAVVPFNSRNVAGPIHEAAFQSSRQGVNQQLAAIPPPQANTALYTAILEALPVLKKKSDAGYAVSLVVLSDGENDVDRPGDDHGLLGPEGLAKAKELAARMKVPITTVGFGVSGNAATVSALKELAWPTADNFYDSATNPQRLSEIFSIAHRKLTDRIQILFGPVRNGRDNLAGQSIPFRVRLRTADGFVAGKSEPGWNAPAVGVPVFETKCSDAELRAIVIGDSKRNGGLVGGRPGSSLLVLTVFSVLLAGLWFGVPRFVWPESYGQTFNQQRSGTPQVDALRGSTVSPPRGGPASISPTRVGAPSPSVGPSPMTRQAKPTQPQTIVIPRRNAPEPTSPPTREMRPTEPQTLVIPRRNAPEPTSPPTREMTPAESQTMVIPPRSVPQEPEPTVSRDPGDETIFRPFSRDPKKDR